MEQENGIDGYDLAILIEPLQRWFLKNARQLAWRAESPNPYHVWLSEIMLQQTRVEAVKPYFARFISELPDVAALSKCPEERLLKLWEGLGYYNRVRNLKAAAGQIMEEYGGSIPNTYEKLLTLKGIGHYTAGAIASIAFGEPYPAVDGNVLRVLARVTADFSDIGSQSVRSHVEEVLQHLMVRYRAGQPRPTDHAPFSVIYPGVFNQALMELGALVCVPNGEPHCGECPWQRDCRARQRGCQNELPVKSRPAKRRVEEKTVLVLHLKERVALHRRPKKGLLAGLYELPNLEGHLPPEAVLEELKRRGAIPTTGILPLPDAKHIFSHVEWHMRGYAVQLEEAGRLGEELVFVDVEELGEHYAVPAAFAVYKEFL